MAKPEKEKWVETRRTVKSKGKVISERVMIKIVSHDKAEQEIKEFWDKVPLRKGK